MLTPSFVLGESINVSIKSVEKFYSIFPENINERNVRTESKCVWRILMSVLILALTVPGSVSPKEEGYLLAGHAHCTGKTFRQKSYIVLPAGLCRAVTVDGSKNKLIITTE